MGARAERNEYLLLHEFHKKKYICPDRAPFKKAPPPTAEDDDGMRRAGAHSAASETLVSWPLTPVHQRRWFACRGTEERTTGHTAKAKSGRAKAAYTGGLVLDPKRGFYDKYVLLLDFNSLYPSIIQEYNICFTTVQRTPGSADGSDGDDGAEPQMPEVPDPNLDAGVLPRILRTLVQRRRQVKALMKAANIDPAEFAQVRCNAVAA